MGQPTLYTPEIVKEICDRLCKGEPLEQICRDERMPSSSTIHSWTRFLDGKKAEGIPQHIAEDIAHARTIGYDAIANEARLVARGEPGISTGDVARDRLIIETDLKLLAKWHAKKYSDKPAEITINTDNRKVISVSEQALRMLTTEQLLELDRIASAEDVKGSTDD